MSVKAVNQKKYREQVLQKIEENREETVASLLEFLGHASRMTQEAGAQTYYAKLLEKMGLDVDKWEPQPEDMSINPNFMACRDSYKGSPNVAAVCHGTGNGRSLMLSGHVDVVPEGAGWSKEPFTGVREEGKIYGRGSADMKGGLIANYMALKAILDCGIRLKGDVILASVIGEETGGAGTLSLIKRGYKADAGIIPEPSDMAICPVSMGVIWYRVNVKGLQAHAANAHLGVSAIDKAFVIASALEKCNKEERMTLKHPLYNEVPNPFNINIGTLQAGSFPTSVPGEAEITGRIAFSPEEDVEEAKKVLEDAVYRAARLDPWMKNHPPQVEWYGFCLNSGKVEMDHPLLTLMKKKYWDVTGKDARVIGTPWGTDAGSLIRFGGTPTIVFGPGPRETAHQVDEYVSEEKLIQVAGVIACTILDWCEVSEQ